MSWSVGNKGTDKEALKKAIRQQAESPLSLYGESPEGADIRAALDRIDGLIDAMVLGEKNYEGKVLNGITVHAYGSHSTLAGGTISGSFSVSVAACLIE